MSGERLFKNYYTVSVFIYVACNICISKTIMNESASVSVKNSNNNQCVLIIKIKLMNNEKIKIIWS